MNVNAPYIHFLSKMLFLWQNGLMAFFSCDDMKTWYNQKIFVNFVDFSCMMFWAKNVLIPPDQNLSMPVDQNVLILLVSSIYNENIWILWHKNYAWTLDIVQSFCEFCK